ncbi:MAG TPA: hypothetical protein VF576_01480 [Rubricoccaceae bacterium]
MRAVFLLHLLATLTMFGAIWTVQVVHYPLFARVGAAGWAAYEAGHQSRITLVVGPAMVVELVTAVLLVLYRPAAFPAGAVLAGALLVGLVWASTAFVQVPLHNALSGGTFDADAHARLVATNWARTAAWTARAGLVLWLAWRATPGLAAAGRG